MRLTVVGAFSYWREIFLLRISDRLFLGNGSGRRTSRCCVNIQIVTDEIAIGSVDVVW
jgi:hypothetical protein